MSEIFKALANLTKKPDKKHFAMVEGKEVEVSLDKKLEMMRHGEENYMFKGEDIVLRPRPRPKTQYSVLRKAEKGYVFQDGDIHWPIDTVEGGEAWLIEYE